MTRSTFFLKWRHNRANYGQISNHLEKKTICSNKKVSEFEHKHRENVKKGRSIKREIKPCTHIHIICKQKEWNA
jgi:hypothetical protein